MLNQITPKLHLVMAVNTDIVASKTNNEYAFSKKKLQQQPKKIFALVLSSRINHRGICWYTHKLVCGLNF